MTCQIKPAVVTHSARKTKEYPPDNEKTKRLILASRKSVRTYPKVTLAGAPQVRGRASSGPRSTVRLRLQLARRPRLAFALWRSAAGFSFFFLPNFTPGVRASFIPARVRSRSGCAQARPVRLSSATWRGLSASRCLCLGEGMEFHAAFAQVVQHGYQVAQAAA